MGFGDEFKVLEFMAFCEQESLVRTLSVTFEERLYWIWSKLGERFASGSNANRLACPRMVGLLCT